MDTGRTTTQYSSLQHFVMDLALAYDSQFNQMRSCCTCPVRNAKQNLRGLNVVEAASSPGLQQRDWGGADTT